MGKGEVEGEAYSEGRNNVRETKNERVVRRGKRGAERERGVCIGYKSELAHGHVPEPISLNPIVTLQWQRCKVEEYALSATTSKEKTTAHINRETANAH